jgi:ABC-type antimicrobial peptide transport system permease subunit
MVHRQYVELQIKLADLQANLQYCLTVAFGFFAGFLTILLCLFQVGVMLPFEESFRIVRVSIMILMIIVGFCCIFFAYYYVRKALRFINKIEDLGKEYSL